MRTLSRLLAVTSVLCLMCYLSGCAGLATWITDAQNIIPLISAAVTGILALITALTGKTVPADVAAKIGAVFTDVENTLTDIENLVKQYQANASPSILADITEAVNLVKANLTELLTDVSITDPATQAKISEIVSFVLTELTAWATLIPTLTATAGMKLELTVPMDAKTFKAGYNTIIEAGTGNFQVDAALASLKKMH